MIRRIALPFGIWLVTVCPVVLAAHAYFGCVSANEAEHARPDGAEHRQTCETYCASADAVLVEIRLSCANCGRPVSECICAAGEPPIDPE